MSASIEEFFRQFVGGKIVDTAHRHADFVHFRVFTQTNAQAHAFHFQWFVDQSLGIAANIVELLHVLARDGEKPGFVLVEETQTLSQYIREEAQTVFRPRIIDISVDLILVNSFGEQVGDDDKNLRIVRRIGKTTRVGHHTTIDARRGIARKFIESPKLENEFEHQLASARRLRARNDEVSRLLVRSFVMIDH